MKYCDASLLVALLVNELHSPEASRWARAQGRNDLVGSDWTITEVGSALAFKLRNGAIDPESHAIAVASAEQLFATLRLVRVEQHHFESAGLRHVFAGTSGLRAGDALHLAVVVNHGFSLATLDRRFAEAAERSGVEVEPVLVAH